MFDGFLRKLFGSSNERRIKGYRPRVDEINALERELEKLSDDALRARTEEFRKQLADGKTLDDILVPAFATCREAAKRTLGQRHFDVQLIGGMILHEGTHLRDEDRRRQDAGRDACGLSQRARRQGRACRHRQRLPRQARRRMDGPDLRLPRADHRRDRARHRGRRAQGGLRLRRHLRHQQRARLRLSARQHEVPARGHGAARPCVRDRRRGGLDPDRRGAHAADHLRPARRPLGFLQHDRRLHSRRSTRPTTRSTRSSAPST